MAKKNAAIEFAEAMATYFKNIYDNTPLEEDCYDFHGMVVLWNVGDKALVANINLNEQFAFFNYENGIPDELVSTLEKSKLKHLLDDSSDNSCIELLYINCSSSELRELFTCVSEEAKEDFIQAAQEIEINF